MRCAANSWTWFPAASPGRTNDEEIIIFDFTGTAIEDVASAAVAYERALDSDVLSVRLAR